ncbi:MAG: xylulokinase [Spirochaetaceae bacterium]
MSSATFLGVDVGTQGTKAVAYSADGACLAESFRPSNLIEGPDGSITEDPEEQVEAVCGAIADCVQQGVDPHSVAALAIDGQMAGVLAVGTDGTNVTPYDSWLDTRCGAYARRMAETAGDRILEKTGNVPSINHGPKILWWKHERPEVYEQIAAFVQPAAYTAMRLCGLRGDEAFIDLTYLHFSGFADNAAADWDADLCRQFEVDRDMFPRIVKPSERVGAVSTEGARRSGLREGTPVMAGCGDTAASFLASGAIEEGICVDVAGTASVFSVTSDSFRPDTVSKLLGCGQSVSPGRWHHYAYINGGGMNLEWFRGLLAAYAASKGTGAPTTAIDFERLNEEAAALEPKMTDPYFVPHMAGRVMPSVPEVRGGWQGLNWSHSGAHLYRSMLEAVALEYGMYLRAIRSVHPTLELQEVRVTGGGEKSRLWNQIKADACGVPMVQVKGSRGAPMGAAMVAAYGTGAYDSLEELVSAWIEQGTRISPDANMQEYYGRRGQVYERLLDVVSQLSVETELGVG